MNGWTIIHCTVCMAYWGKIAGSQNLSYGTYIDWSLDLAIISCSFLPFYIIAVEINRGKGVSQQSENDIELVRTTVVIVYAVSTLSSDEYYRGMVYVPLSSCRFLKL